MDRLASSQHGVVAVAQLHSLGWSAAAHQHAVRSGRLVPVRRGVLRVRGAPSTWEAAVLAACLAGGPDVVASHSTAAHLWGLVVGRREIAVSCPRALNLAGIRAHRRQVAAGDRSVRVGIPVTTPARTLLDLAEEVGPEAAAAVVDEALRNRLVRIEALHLAHAATVRQGGRRAGALALGQVLRDRPVHYDPGASAWEADMDRAWEAWGLPPAERQHEVVTPHGRYRPDRAIVGLRIAVDWNGFEFHGGRGRFDADSDRRADLTTAGWLPLDFTSRSSPERICRTVLAAVEQRAGSR